MKRITIIFGVSLVCLLQGCASSSKVIVPTVVPVKTHIALASSASARSSQEIRKFKTKAEHIEYKATKALELF
jgi:hypothetical protein